MARTIVGGSLFVLLAGCGGSSPPPARHAQAPTREQPAESANTTLETLDGQCAPDRTPIEVGDNGLGSEPLESSDDSVGFRIARRTEHGVIGIACTRAAFGGEVSLETDAIETTIGGTPVVLVVDTAHCNATCEGEEAGETERCESAVTSAWVLDRDLRLIGAVSDQQGGSAGVEEGNLVVGNAKRTLRAGALVAP